MSRCKYVLLAKSGECSVHTCSCGTVNIHMKSITIRVSPQELIEISNVLGAASERYVEYIKMLKISQGLTNDINNSDRSNVDKNLKIKIKNDEVIH